MTHLGDATYTSMDALTVVAPKGEFQRQIEEDGEQPE